MDEEPGFSTGDPGQEAPRSSRGVAQFLELPPEPANQVRIDPLEGSDQPRPVVAAEVADPTPRDEVDFPRHRLPRRTAAQMELPTSDGLPHSPPVLLAYCSLSFSGHHRVIPPVGATEREVARLSGHPDRRADPWPVRVELPSQLGR